MEFSVSYWCSALLSSLMRNKFPEGTKTPVQLEQQEPGDEFGRLWVFLFSFFFGWGEGEGGISSLIIALISLLLTIK